MSDSERTSKPWYRPRNVILGVVVIVAVFLGWVVFETLRLMNAEPNPTRDYWSEHLDRVREHFGVEKEPAAETWRLLEETLNEGSLILDQYETELNEQAQAGALPSRFDGDGPTFDFSHVIAAEVPLNKLDREREAIRRLREAGVFETLNQVAARAPGVTDREIEGMLLQAFLPELADARRLAAARVASMRLALLEGDQREVAGAFDQTRAVAQSISADGFLISYLVGVAIDFLLVTEINAELVEVDFEPDVCRSLLASLGERELIPITLALEGERAIFYDFVQRVYSDDGDDDGYVIADELGDYLDDFFGLGVFAVSPLEAFIARFFFPGRAETIHLYDYHLDATIGEAAKTSVDRWQIYDPETAIDADSLDMFIAGMLLPALKKSVDNASLYAILVEGTKVAVAVELYHAMHGEFPETLEALEPEIFQTIPRDPLHGGPFGYRLLEEPDEYGREFLLYSTGFDQQDDGGRELSRNELSNGERAAVIDRTTTGADYIINRPRRSYGE